MVELRSKQPWFLASAPQALLEPSSVLGFDRSGGAQGYASRPLLAEIVYQATLRDPLLLEGVVITMALLGLLATWIPAERALQVHPARLLREE